MSDHGHDSDDRKSPEEGSALPDETKVIASMEEMQEAMQKDRGCCFLAFYHCCRTLAQFSRATILCEECRIEWLIERIPGMGMQFFPLGVRPRIAVVKNIQ